MAQVLAIIQGLESQYSLKLSHEFIKTYYESALELYLANYIAVKTESGYEIKEHAPKWNRRIR